MLLAGLMLAAIPALGPGYGPQYAYWYVPPLLASYVLLDDGWRRILLAFYAVAAVTYVVEYALLIALGRFLVAFFRGSASSSGRASGSRRPARETLLRVPLFIAFLVLLVAGVRRLRLLIAPAPSESVSVSPLMSRRQLDSTCLRGRGASPSAGAGVAASLALGPGTRRRSCVSTTRCRSRSSRSATIRASGCATTRASTTASTSTRSPAIRLRPARRIG